MFAILELLSRGKFSIVRNPALNFYSKLLNDNPKESSSIVITESIERTLLTKGEKQIYGSTKTLNSRSK